MRKIQAFAVAACVLIAAVFALPPPRAVQAQSIERPTQIVATNATVKSLVNSYAPVGCVAISVAAGTSDMLAAAYTVPHGVRQLVLSAAFQNATIVYARINGVNLALLSAQAFGADQLTGPIAVPVEEGDTVNFRLSVANDGAATRKFKVEAVSGW